MSARLKTTRGATVAMALAAAMAGAGCGDSEKEPTASIESVPTAPGGLRAEREPGRSGPRRSDSPSRPADSKEPHVRRPSRRELRQALGVGPDAGAGDGDGTSLQQSVARAIRRLPRTQRDQAVRATAQSVFAGFGLSPPRVSITSDVGVRAMLGRGQACTATAHTEANLTRMLRGSLPWLKPIQIVVAPAGEGLSEYVRRHCNPPALPGGTGRVVLTEHGSGLHETRSFTVRSRRWAVEYINGGRGLHIMVMRNGLPSGGTLQATRRGPGRQTLSGAGTYTLHIATHGEWVVRVRDGA